MSENFVIKQITVYNYTSDNKLLKGNIKIFHNNTGMEMDIPMKAEDVAAVFEIFADRISTTMGEASRAVFDQVKPQLSLTADDDIPY